jgi:hypothetical protein
MTIFRPDFGGLNPLNKRVTQLAAGEPIKAQGTGQLNGKPCVIVVTDRTATVSDGTLSYSAPLVETFVTPTAGMGLLTVALGGKQLFIRKMPNASQVLEVEAAINFGRGPFKAQ